MALDRYSAAPIITTNGKNFRMSSEAGIKIRSAVKKNQIQVQRFTLAEGQRLDVVAANYYGLAEYWWVIAAASGIGWQCQVPAGTVIIIPTSLQEISTLV
jgi:hypothetical protein